MLPENGNVDTLIREPLTHLETIQTFDMSTPGHVIEAHSSFDIDLISHVKMPINHNNKNKTNNKNNVIFNDKKNNNNIYHRRRCNSLCDISNSQHCEPFRNEQNYYTTLNNICLSSHPHHMLSSSLFHSFSPSNDVDDTIDSNENEDEPIEDSIELYRQYRKEFEELKQNSFALEREHYIELLESMVYDLLEQNQCLVENITELKTETNKRVEAIHQQLDKSARHTEEVMLALESHEISLKHFVQRHCCTCCGCDMRLMDFKICHGNDCDLTGHFNKNNSFGIQSLTGQCWSYGLEWNSIINQIQAWLSRSGHLSDFIHKDNYRSTSANFMPLIEGICTRINKLENENEELKYDNQMVRELNGLLSGRKSSIIRTTQECSFTYEKNTGNVMGKHQESLQDASTMTTLEPQYRLSSIDSDTLSLNQLFDQGDNDSVENTSDLNQDLMTFLSKTGKQDLDCSYFDNDQLLDMNHSCLSESRSDSLTSRHEMDSGCGADLIPSQADTHSLFSECELNVGLGSLLDTSQQLTNNKEEGTDYLTSDISEHSDCDHLRQRLELAERLVPKLYNKLIYYIGQRNLLLKQFYYETNERKKCKDDLSNLLDSIQFEMKDLEENSKIIKQIPSTTFTIH